MGLSNFIVGLLLLTAGIAIWIAWVTLLRRRHSIAAARAYLKGFRYILSDEPNAALAELTRASEDSRSVETYFALGALFRRTGEFERAIRLHQNMLLKPNLEPRIRQQICWELALDYHRAGILERAAECYKKILESEPAHRETLLKLREIYEDQRDFASATQMQAKLVETQQGSVAILAHLLAETSLQEADLELALDFAARATQIHPSGSISWFALGQAQLKNQDCEQATSSFQKACILDPEMSLRSAEPLRAAMGEQNAIAFFQKQIEENDHASARVALAGLLRYAGSISQATLHLRRALELDCGYVEARVELGRTLLESTMGDEARRELEALLNALGQQTPGFLCDSCGHGYAELQFRCDACRSWNTIHRRKK